MSRFYVGQRVRVKPASCVFNLAGKTVVIHSLVRMPLLITHHPMDNCVVDAGNGDLWGAHTDYLEPPTPPHEAADDEAFLRDLDRMAEAVGEPA